MTSAEGDARRSRLEREAEVLRELAQASTILDYEAGEGQPPERYTLLFHGPGLRPRAGGGGEFVRLHRVELRLPAGYPQAPPDIRWITPIFHPNIPKSGIVEMAHLGLDWAPDFTLDLVCEQLWDLARLARLDPDSACQPIAGQWFRDACQLDLPLDPRPLRDSLTPSPRNVIRFQRKREHPLRSREPDEVLYIDEFGAIAGPEETPTDQRLFIGPGGGYQDGGYQGGGGPDGTLYIGDD